MTKLAAALMTILLLAAFPAAGQTIPSFQSQIEVFKDGSLLVVETVNVRWERGDAVPSAIRFFPLYHVGSTGQSIETDIKLQSVLRNGVVENWTRENTAGGFYIKAVKHDDAPEASSRVYQITYTVGPQLRNFENRDDLFWEVTGRDWQMPIEKASAAFVFPEGIKPDSAVSSIGFGDLISKRDWAKIVGNRVFVATPSFDFIPKHQGLVMSISLPKGAISAGDRSAFDLLRWRDSPAGRIGLIGLAALMLYCAGVWLGIGRGARKRTLAPQWHPPEQSVATVSYILKRGFPFRDWTALSASVTELAVKGLLMIDDLAYHMVIHRTGGRYGLNIPAEQHLILETIGPSDQPLTIEPTAANLIDKLQNAFGAEIDHRFKRRYFHSKTAYVLPVLVFCVGLIAAMAYFDPANRDLVTIYTVFFPGLFLAGGLRLCLFLRDALVSRKTVDIACALLLSAGAVSGALSFIVNMSLSHSYLVASLHWPIFVSIAGALLVFIIFGKFWSGLTPLGRRTLDHFEALRAYLILPEPERMRLVGAPAMSPEHFEALLPYAVALGVEKPWAEKFEAWHKTTRADVYQPTWYRGHLGQAGNHGIGAVPLRITEKIAGLFPS
jgi:fumarate reductase subunit D